MKKRLLSLLLVLALALSLALPAMAAGYSDLEGHWAEPYMMDLSNRGYLNGYEDGTMRPDNDITACETLVMLSRLYNPDQETRAWIESDYEAVLKANVPEAFSWAYDELSICLAAGIVTETELQKLTLDKPLEKEQLCVFTVRAIQLTDRAAQMAGQPLTFDDAEDISESAWGSVTLLVSLGVIQGDDHNCFGPSGTLTRAVAATIVSRVLGYVDTNGLELKIAAYDNVTRTEGIFQGVEGSGVISVCRTDGMMCTYAIPSTAKVTVNGETRALSTQYKGGYIRITEQNGAVVTVDLTSGGETSWVQGELHTRYSSYGDTYITVTDPDTGEDTRCTTDLDTVFLQDGRSVKLTELLVHSFVTVEMKNGVAQEVTADSAIHEVTGTISTLTYGSTVDFCITDKSGTVWDFPLDIKKLPTILRNNAEVGIDRLNIGDEVKVQVKGGDVTSITSDATEETFTGQLTSMVTTADGTVWTIQASNGAVRNLTLDKTVTVHRGDATLRLSDIGINDTVTVKLYGDVITDVNRDSSGTVITDSKLTGSVLVVDSGTITLLQSGKLIYVKTTSSTVILDPYTGRNVKLSTLEPDTFLVVYGSFTDSNTFRASTIIAE